MHLFNPALGNLFNYCIFKNHLFIHQKKFILIYDLNKLTFLNSISLGDKLITDISVLKDGIILENSEVPLLLDSIGNVKDLNFSLSDNLVTRYVQNGHRIFGIQKNKSDQILVEVDKEKVMPTINIFNKGVNKFYIIKDEIFILEQDKINIISKLNLLPKKKIFINERPSCIMKDKRGFFWIGTLNKGIFIIDDFYNELIPIPEMEYALSEIIDSFLFLGTTKGEVFRTDLHTLKTELIYKTTPPYQIYDIIYLPQLSKPLVNYTNYFGFKYCL